MKIKKILNRCEFNKTTEDVELDIKHLQIGDNIKAFLFYGITIGVSLYAALAILNSVSEDSFKSDLIKKAGVPPLLTYFYTDYSKDEEFKGEIDRQILIVQEELNKLKSFSNSETFSYTTSDFLNEVSSGNITINVSDFTNEFNEYKKQKYFSTLLKNKKENLMLGDNEYSINEISNRLKSLSIAEAKEQADLPVQKLIEKFGFDANDKEAVFTALYEMNSVPYTLVRFYENLGELEPDFNKVLFAALKNKQEAILITSNFGTKKIPIENLSSLVEKRKVEKEAEYAKSKADFEKEKASVEVKIKKLQEQEKSLYEIIKLVNEITRDVSKYSENADKIDDLKGEIEWTSK